MLAGPAAAQGILLLRDTETERALRSYEDPLLKAGGLDPAGVRIYLVNDPTVNSFVAEGQNMFIQSGMIMFAHNSLELKGVMAHETGHIVAGHLSRGTAAIQKAMIPMLLSMVVGIAAIAAGAGQAGMLILLGGQGIAQDPIQRLQPCAGIHSRPDRAQAAQQDASIAARPAGDFTRLADEEARAYDRMDPYASDHPMGRDRVANLEAEVEASPYKDVPEDPAVEHEYEMIQAKLAGYIEPLQVVFNRYPLTDKSETARYARAMAYSRKPDLPKALDEINSLIKDEPNNPYFYEVLGQIYVSMAKPELGVVAYQKSVDLMPNAPQLRVALGAAQLATERPALAKPALENLKVALQQEDDDPFAWYEAAQAYSQMGNEPMADLATAERYYSMAPMRRPRCSPTRRATAWTRARPTGSAQRHRPPSPCPPRARSSARRPDERTFGRYAMTTQWRIAALSAFGGAVVAVGVVFGAAAFGYFPTARVDTRQVHAYLLKNPQILAEMQERYAALQEKREDVAERARQMAADTAGPKAFFDPAGRLCDRASERQGLAGRVLRLQLRALPQHLSDHQGVLRGAQGHSALRLRRFPDLWADVDGRARAAVAARRQPDKYIPFTFALMSEPGAIDLDVLMRVAQASGLDIAKLTADMKDPATDKTLARARALAKRVNVDGTPTFIVNGKVHSGEIDEDTLKQMTGT
ncbi:MAG: M48 family metalloprotease [Rhizomicrobium sp.]